MCAIFGVISLITILSRTMLMFVLILDRFLTVSTLPKSRRGMMLILIVILTMLQFNYRV